MTSGYGEYILGTGCGITGQHESLMGEYWYRTRFAGMKPILDVGPGRCWFSRQAPSDIVAIDNSPKIVDHFKREGIDIRLGDAARLPIPDGTVQGVFCCWLLEHLAEPQAAVREFYRVLKAGGYACVIVPTPRDMNAFYDDYTHVRPFTANSLTQLATEAGFKRYRTEYLPWVRGISRVIRHCGSDVARAYVAFGDRWLRKCGLRNRNNIVLEAWK